MDFYHGTTLSSARGIIENGFRPRGGTVWFTTHWNYAKNRAEQKARRKNGRPVVLKTELEIEELRTHFGKGKIHVHGNIIAVRERLSVQLLESNFFELLACPAALSQWVNRQLGLYAHNGVSQNHWGIVRLAHLKTQNAGYADFNSSKKSELTNYSIGVRCISKTHQ